MADVARGYAHNNERRVEQQSVSELLGVARGCLWGYRLSAFSRSRELERYPTSRTTASSFFGRPCSAWLGSLPSVRNSLTTKLGHAIIIHKA